MLHFGICLHSPTDIFTLCRDMSICYFVSYKNFVSRYENEDGITFKSFNANGSGLASEELKKREMLSGLMKEGWDGRWGEG